MAKKMTFIIGILMLPATAAAMVAFFETLGLGKTVLPWDYQSSTAYFFYGFIAYTIIHLCFHQPILTYVFGHELTHALWGKLFFAKVSDFTVTKQGGHVRVSKSNFLITLAPYFFPIYTVFVLVLYLGLALIWPPIKHYDNWAQFVLGITWAFHLILTVATIREGQSDITSVGTVFSLQFILLVNFEVHKALMHWLNASSGFMRFNRLWWEKIQDYYGGMGEWAVSLVQSLI